MKPITLSVTLVLLIEAGTALVLFNAAPHPPLGFWLWFGGLAVLSPAVGFWIYKSAQARKKRNA